MGLLWELIRSHVRHALLAKIGPLLGLYPSIKIDCNLENQGCQIFHSFALFTAFGTSTHIKRWIRSSADKDNKAADITFVLSAIRTHCLILCIKDANIFYFECQLYSTHTIYLHKAIGEISSCIWRSPHIREYPS